MKTLDVTVPNTGVEGQLEVIDVCVAVGDKLETDVPIIVLESDKATVEVPCPSAGSVVEIDVSVGDKVSDGELILKMDVVSEHEAEGRADAASETAGEDLVAAHEGLSVEIEEDADQLAESQDATLHDVLVPDLGGSESVEVIEVGAKAGQMIESDQALIVLESDKATMEIPSPVSGEIKSIQVVVGDKLSSGDIIATVLSSDELSSGEASAEGASVNDDTQEKAGELSSVRPELSSTPGAQIADTVGQKASRVHAGPGVRKYGRELGVDLTQVRATGPKGRILKEDLTAYVKTQVTSAQGGSGLSNTHALPAVELPDFSKYGRIDKSKMDKIQRATAENMQTSWLTVPHVTQFDEADITEMEAFRKARKQAAEARGVKLTPMAFLLKACAYVLAQLPQFNVSLDMKAHQVIRKHFIHIGVAVDTPNGLMVPVIKDVDQKSLWQLADECQQLASRARDRKLTPVDMQGGCFTISSLGGLGGTSFTPIVNTPEVAILGVSKAQYKPVYNASLELEPRLMLPLSLSYDHRAVNGADAARFTTLLSRVLEDLRELLL